MKRLLGVLAGLALVWGASLWWDCCGPRPPWPRPLSDLQVAEAWLHCMDCHGSFLRRLHEMPARSQDTVTKFLGVALINGPDSARTARHTSDLVRAWQADSSSRVRRGEKPDTGFSSFTSRYQDGFDTRWRTRAAVALGVIRTPAAISALDGGLGLPLLDKGDSVVRRAVIRARSDTGLVALGHYTP
ncbi:MAG: hypothetical protein ACREOQ_18530 [Gemmatimonadales bacterium]